MFIIEDYPLQNPHYHSANDNLDTLNLDFHTNVTRSLIAAIASIGGAYPNEDRDNDGIPNNNDNCPIISNPDQLDTRPTNGNDCGDACECEADLDGDGEVGGFDTTIYKADYPRNIWNHPCTNLDPCLGDLDCDGEVGGFDTNLFKADYPRNEFVNPCPACSRNGFPCTYPE